VALFQQIAFIIVLGVAAYFIRQRILRIRDNIRLGKKNDVKDHPGQRLSNMLLVAFGQKKMFKRFIPAILHFFIYAGFLIINLEVLEFVIDGILGTHRIFAPYLGRLYSVLMNGFEFLAMAVLLACVAFLVRRNVLKVPRFWSAEMTSWPRLDANLILTIEIALMLAILTMNGTDQVLQTRDAHYQTTGSLFFSSSLTSTLQHLNTESHRTQN